MHFLLLIYSNNYFRWLAPFCFFYLVDSLYDIDLSDKSDWRLTLELTAEELSPEIHFNFFC